MKYEFKPGDIWQLGRHRLMCADTTADNIEGLFEDMGGGTADFNRPAVWSGIRGK